MEPTLEASLRRVFGEAQGAPKSENTTPDVTAPSDAELDSLESQINSLLESYDKFRQSAQQNDWKSMGDSMQTLDEQMERLRQYSQR